MGEDQKSALGPVGEQTGRPAEPPRAEVAEPPREGPAALTETPVRCPVCGGCGGKAVAGGGDIVRCEGCGTWFRKRRPSRGQLVKLREALFENAFALPHHEARRAVREQTYEVMRGYFKIKKGKAAALNAFERYVLDIACGPGFRLQTFVSYGWIEAGTETSPTAYEYAKRQQFDVKHGWFTQLGFGETRFDLGLFARNFGELPDPLRAVEKLHEVVKPDALVCVLREPLAVEGQEPRFDDTRLFVYTADALKRLVCEKWFSFVSEELGEGEGTFWFRVKFKK